MRHGLTSGDSDTKTALAIAERVAAAACRSAYQQTVTPEVVAKQSRFILETCEKAAGGDLRDQIRGAALAFKVIDRAMSLDSESPPPPSQQFNQINITLGDAQREDSAALRQMVEQIDAEPVAPGMVTPAELAERRAIEARHADED